MEHESTGTTRRRDLAQKVSKTEPKDRFVVSASLGYIDGLIEYYDQDKIGDAFRIACKNGHLDVAKWLYGLGGIDIHTDNEYVFIETCTYERLNVAQWLYSLTTRKGRINIHALGDKAFRSAATFGHLDVAKWLYSLGAVLSNRGRKEILVNNKHDSKMYEWIKSLPTGTKKY